MNEPAAAEPVDADQVGEPVGTPSDEGDRPAGSAQRWVWRLIAALAAVAVTGSVLVVLQDPPAAVPGVVWLTLLPLFAVAEVLVIHLPAMRSSHSHTLREIPAIAGLTFLAPQQYLTVYVLGAGLALMVWTRMRGTKLAFNLSLFGVEAVVGCFAYHAVLQSHDPMSLRAWLAAGVAVGLTDLLSAAAVTTAISVTEGAFDVRMWWQALRTGASAAVINTCAALLVVTLIVARPSALPLLGVMIGMLVVAYRVFVSLARSHARTQMLYRFVGSTGRESDSDQVTKTVLEEAAKLLKAANAHLVLAGGPDLLTSGSAPVVVHSYRDGSYGQETLPEGVVDRSWWHPALRGKAVRHDTVARAVTRADERPATTSPGPDGAAAVLMTRDGVAVPVPLADGRCAALVVTDRTFEAETFSEDDLALLQTLGAHAAVAMDKAHMLGQLSTWAAERAHDALHDPLTGLPNRRAFNEALAEALAGASQAVPALGAARRSVLGPAATAEVGVVLLLDVDNFKDVNDTLGHTAGDRLLEVTGQRLSTAAGAFVARLGGDEFAVLLTGADIEQGVACARGLHELLSAPVPLDRIEISTTVSIGVAAYRRLSGSADEVLAQADMAMYAAKSDRSGVAVFRPEDANATSRRLALAAELPGALDRGELTLSYQPLAVPGSDVVAGFEALLRWNHRAFGAIPAPEIISVAHRTGLLRQVTDYVLHRALEGRAAWNRHGYDLTVSVNVSAIDVCDNELVVSVSHLLDDTCTPPDRLTLEVTESDAMREPDRALQVLQSLADQGVRLAIDDFGTGYSSLAYLDRLPVHELKIDQSFVLRLERQAADSTIVRATVALAHDLRLTVVAEGVETDLAKSLVQELGCDLYQGYGLSRPLPEDEVLEWLSRHDAHLARRSAGGLAQPVALA